MTTTNPAADTDPSFELSPELEARFIEQEHRIVRVVQNYFDRKRWAIGDPRRVAARNAVIWRLLAPGTAAVTAGGLVALSSLAVLVWQTKLIGDQNMFFKDQNEKLQVQLDQQWEQDTTRRRTEIIAILYETVRDIEGREWPKANYRTRHEAVLEFAQLERQRVRRMKERLAGLIPAHAVNFTAARLDGLNLVGADLSNVGFEGANLTATSFLAGNLDNSDFRDAALERTSFNRSSARHTNFQAARLYEVSFILADLRMANLKEATPERCNFYLADLRGADLAFRTWDQYSVFRNTNIAGATLGANLKKHLLSQGAVELANDADWDAFRRRLTDARGVPLPHRRASE